MMLSPKAVAGSPPSTNDQLAGSVGSLKWLATGTVGRLTAHPDHAAEVWLELVLVPQRSPRCSSCDQVVATIREIDDRWVWNMPAGNLKIRKRQP